VRGVQNGRLKERMTIMAKSVFLGLAAGVYLMLLPALPAMADPADQGEPPPAADSGSGMDSAGAPADDGAGDSTGDGAVDGTESAPQKPDSGSQE
jgi:hypothetical protein